MIRLALFLPFLLALTSPPQRSDCGNQAYPWEFSTYCPTGMAVFVCADLGGFPVGENWHFVGCWEF